MYDNIEKYFEELFNLPKSDKVDKWRHVFNSMAVHTRKRVPEELLLARRPNEDQKIFEYRKANYRAITYGSMNKALDDLSRIVSGISYTVNAPDNVMEYLNTFSIEQFCAATTNEIITPKLFIEKIALKRDIEDPNGFLVWFPSGEGLEDSSEKVTPTPKLVLSDQYIYSDKNVFIFKSEEKSPLKNGDVIELSGDVYYFLTKNEIWRMFETGTVSEKVWKQEKVYSHNLEAFPVIVLGGDINAEGFYESFFSPYLAFGDEAIHQFSDWQAIMTTSSFPIKEMFGTECQVRKINKTSNNPSDQEEGFSGGGNGSFELVLTQPDPYGVIPRRVPLPNLNDDALPVDIPSIRYINPDISIAKYSGESWEKLKEKAEQSLNIDMTVGLDQSGLAKQIDKESQYSMITKIGNNFFDNIYLNSIKIIDGYLNRVTFKSSTCTISKPATFWVKSELELITEITQLKSSNAPGFFLQEAAIELAKKRFNGSPVKQKMFAFISVYDPYFALSGAEKNMQLASGTMTKEDVIRSQRMSTILNQMVEELTAKVFIEKSLADINKEFEKRVAEFFPEEELPLTDDNGNTV